MPCILLASQLAIQVTDKLIPTPPPIYTSGAHLYACVYIILAILKTAIGHSVSLPLSLLQLGQGNPNRLHGKASRVLSFLFRFQATLKPTTLAKKASDREALNVLQTGHMNTDIRTLNMFFKSKQTIGINIKLVDCVTLFSYYHLSLIIEVGLCVLSHGFRKTWTINICQTWENTEKLHNGPYILYMQYCFWFGRFRWKIWGHDKIKLPPIYIGGQKCHYIDERNRCLNIYFF